MSKATLAVGALIGAEAMGITNFTGNQDSNPTNPNPGFSAFAESFGNQMKSIQNQIRDTQTQINNVQKTAVTASELANALSGIENTGVSPNDVETIVEKYFNANAGEPDDSSDPKNTDSSERPNNPGSGGPTPNQERTTEPEQTTDPRDYYRDWMDIREENERDFSPTGLANPKPGTQVGDIIATADTWSREVGKTGRGFGDFVGKTQRTIKEDIDFVTGGDYSSKGTWREGNTENEGKNLFSMGPLYKGPDPLNLGGNNQNNDSESRTSGFWSGP